MSSFRGLPFQLHYFSSIKGMTSLKDFLFFAQRKCEWMGNKDFVLVKKHFIVSLNNLNDLCNLIYTLVCVPIMEIRKCRLWISFFFNLSTKEQSQHSLK